MKPIFLILIIVLFIQSINCQTQNIPVGESYKKQIEELSDLVKEIRRDQLNYQIEKDLLKDAYSSSYNTINTIITFVLALFTILGFMGLKSLSSLRKDYITELEQLRKLRSEFEQKAISIDTESKKLSESLSKIVAQNEEQNQKLKVLDIQEKVRTLIQQDRYLEAIEYANIALEMSAENTSLLHNKAFCYLRLFEYTESLKTYKKILVLVPDDDTAIVNSAELYLLTKQFKEFDEIKSKIVRPEVNQYLNILELGQKGEEENLMQEILKLVGEYDVNFKGKVMNWDFRDLNTYLLRGPQNNISTLLMTISEFLSGKISKAELLAKIKTKKG